MRVLAELLRLNGARSSGRKPSYYAVIFMAAGALLMAPRPLAAQLSCQPALDATFKLFDTSSHSYTTMTVMDKPQTVESIYAGGVVYVLFNGKWTRGGTAAEMKALAEKNRERNKVTCVSVKDELMGGELTTVYTVHEVTPRGTSDSTLWISKSKGVPLRTDTTLNGKTHLSTRYEYDNVKAPM